MFKKFFVFLMFFSLCVFSQNALNRGAFNILGFGARAMGMGGAFIAIADDATAASWNPAGLSQMTSSEISLVYDMYKGDVTWEDYEETNWSDGYSYVWQSVKDEGSTDYSSLAFLSYSMPVQIGNKNLVWQLSYSNLASPPDFENNYTYNGTVYYNGDAIYTEDLEGKWESSGSGAFKTLTLSLGYQIVSNFHMGISLNYLDTNYKETFKDSGNITNSLGESYVFSSSSTRKYDFSDFYFDLGFLYKTEFFSFGGVWHSGFKASGKLKGSNEDLVSGREDYSYDVDVEWPSGYGFGVAVRPIKSLTFALDYSKSNWKDGKITFTDFDETTYFPYLFYDRQFNTSSLRFGMEYVLFVKENVVVPLRAGYFQEDRIAAWFVGGEKPKVDGFTLGSGVTLKNFQIDFAFVRTEGKESATGSYDGFDEYGTYYTGTYDASIKDTQDRFILSFIYKF
ncbi:MAG: hypothetical protein WHV67_08215 [Thermoanaerobaculia bacterium]